MSVLVYDDTFFAALLVYANYWLTQIDYIPPGGESVFHFDMEPWSVEELHTAYLSNEGQGVSDIRAYAKAFKRVERLKGLAKRNLDGKFVDEAWVAGKRDKQSEEKYDG